jgi:tRNA (mo5U34)-methyltransferase
LKGKAKEMTNPMSRPAAQKLVDEQPWWYHQFEIFPGVMTPGVYDVSYAILNLELPDDMSGLSVLELGPSDGAFSLAMWKRGANVTAVDYTDATNFSLMKRVSGCDAKWIKCNALNIDGADLGQFDIVLMMGLLYHLPDPFRALWLARQHLVADGRFVLETAISEKDGASLMEYLPADTSNGDLTNFWRPNAQCCLDMLADCGLVVEKSIVSGERGMFHARLGKDPTDGHKARLAYGTVSVRD